jgi:hypothetical protein
MRILALLIGVVSYTFAGAQLSNGLIAMFPFDQNYNDLGPSAINLTPLGTTFASDRVGLANHGLAFGNQQYLVFNDNAVKVPLPITISVWVNVQSLSASNEVFRSDNIFNDYYGYCLNIAPNTGQVSAHISGGLGSASPGNRRSFYTNSGISTNNWHHIVAIIKGAFDMQIYIDCELQNGTYQGTGATNMLYSNAESRIGSYIGNPVNTSGTYFNGKMDQMVLWNRSLNYDEVRQLCENDNSLALDEMSLTNGVQLYPNPFNNTLYINLMSSFEHEHSFQIMDLQGRIYQEGQIVNETQLQLHLEHLPAGTYLFQVRNEKGTAVQKFNKL